MLERPFKRKEHDVSVHTGLIAMVFLFKFFYIGGRDKYARLARAAAAL